MTVTWRDELTSNEKPQSGGGGTGVVVVGRPALQEASLVRPGDVLHCQNIDSLTIYLIYNYELSLFRRIITQLYYLFIVIINHLLFSPPGEGGRGETSVIDTSSHQCDAHFIGAQAGGHPLPVTRVDRGGVWGNYHSQVPQSMFGGRPPEVCSTFVQSWTQKYLESTRPTSIREAVKKRKELMVNFSSLSSS